MPFLWKQIYNETSQGHGAAGLNMDDPAREVMLLPKSVIIFYGDDRGARWYSPGLVNVLDYPELRPYCLTIQQAEEQGY